MPSRPFDEDRDAPQAMDLEKADGDETVPCPRCGRRIHEDAPVCPHCGCWVEEESEAARRSRGWLWPILVAVLVVVILAVWAGL